MQVVVERRIRGDLAECPLAAIHLGEQRGEGLRRLPEVVGEAGPVCAGGVRRPSPAPRRQGWLGGHPLVRGCNGRPVAVTPWLPCPYHRAHLYPITCHPP